MKIAFLNWNNNDENKIVKSLTNKGFMIIEEKNKKKNYDLLFDSFTKLSNRSIDHMMLDNFDNDFNFFLDYINPKKIKKQKFDITGNKNSTGLLNFIATINNKIRVIYGPSFNTISTESNFEELYEKFAFLISKTEKHILIDTKDDNNDLNFDGVRKDVSGVLFGGNVNSLIDTIETDYFTFKVKGSIVLVDGLSSDLTELRRQITALNQKKFFIGPKAVIFGKVNGIDLSKFIDEEFSELNRLNIIYGFSGSNCSIQNYVLIGKKTIIDKKNEQILQKIA